MSPIIPLTGIDKIIDMSHEYHPNQVNIHSIVTQRSIVPPQPIPTATPTIKRIAIILRKVFIGKKKNYLYFINIIHPPYMTIGIAMS